MTEGWLNGESDGESDSSIGRYTQMKPVSQPDIQRPCSATNSSFPQASTAVKKCRDRSEQELRLVTSRLIPDVYNCIAH